MKARDRQDVRPTIQTKGTNEAGLGSRDRLLRERPGWMNNGSRTSSAISLHSLSEDVLFWALSFGPILTELGSAPFFRHSPCGTKLPQETVHVYPTKEQILMPRGSTVAGKPELNTECHWSSICTSAPPLIRCGDCNNFHGHNPLQPPRSRQGPMPG
jgi:hypothetical protein